MNKKNFLSPNVYWIDISRYEEKSELFTIESDDDYIGLIGGGFDKDGVTGYINPIMIDRNHQKMGYAKPSILLIMEYLRTSLSVDKTNINHRIENEQACIIYESLSLRFTTKRTLISKTIRL